MVNIVFSGMLQNVPPPLVDRIMHNHLFDRVNQWSSIVFSLLALARILATTLFAFKIMQYDNSGFHIAILKRCSYALRE